MFTFASIVLGGDAAAGDLLALGSQGNVAKGHIAWEVISDLKDRHVDFYFLDLIEFVGGEVREREAEYRRLEIKGD